MSESIDMLFGDLRSLLNQSERDVAWTADLTALLELAIGEDRDAFMARWHPYLVSHRLHLTEANFPQISVASIDELERLRWSDFHFFAGTPILNNLLY